MTAAENEPEESGVTICWEFSAVMTITAVCKVSPVTVTVLTVTRASSVGEVSFTVKPSSGLRASGVGVAGLAAEEGGVGVVMDEGRDGAGGLRLLLAVQIPKVIIRPSMKPMDMAKNISFFICLTLT